jgi:hypothetical protein
VKFNQMTDEEKRKLIIAMYFLQKGAHQLSHLHDEFSLRDTDEEIKEAMNKMHNLFPAIARFHDMLSPCPKNSYKIILLYLVELNFSLTSIRRATSPAWISGSSYFRIAPDSLSTFIHKVLMNLLIFLFFHYA